MNTITLSPYLRLSGAGFDIALKSRGNKFRLILMRGDELVATGFTSRGHSMNNADALRRIQLNQFGETTDMFSMVSRLADMAESLSPARATKCSEIK